MSRLYDLLGEVLEFEFVVWVLFFDGFDVEECSEFFVYFEDED